MEPSLWPVIITQDRYTGVYSGGPWLAVGNRRNLFETDAYGDDTDCAAFFEDAKNTKQIGIGDTPNAALDDLLRKVR